MPQSWNRYTYCLNNPLMYVDPEGLAWYKKKGSNQPEWRDENPGDEYEGITQHVYWAGENHGWVGLDPLSKNWKGGFQSQDEALQFIDRGLEVSQIDGTLETSMDLGVPGLVRGVFNIGSGLAASFFAREAVETAAETNTRGLSMEGLAFERRFLSQHLEGTSQAANQIARDGKAFVFNDVSTLSRVESEIFSHRAFTGTTTQGSRIWARYGFQSDRPIGVRMAQGGTRTPLTYG